MTSKSDLIEKLASKTGTTKAQAQKSFDELFEIIGDELAGKNIVSIAGFGSFQIAHRGQRTGRNPQTGAPITIKAKSVVKFKAGKKLADLVNK